MSDWLESRNGEIKLKKQENDPEFKYHSGNEEPHRGFGHIAIIVDDLEAAVKRFDSLGVKFKKRPEDGRMKVRLASLKAAVDLLERDGPGSDESGDRLHLRSRWVLDRNPG